MGFRVADIVPAIFMLLLGTIPCSFLLANELRFADGKLDEAFCERGSELENFSIELSKPENRLAFLNDGGLFNGGVCWWHSRLQRSATYLAVFHPEAPVPSLKEARKIIRDLAKNRGVVMIPGYSNLFDFSLAWRAEIQRQLNHWQRTDGFLRFSWVDGLNGTTKKSPAKFANMMNELFSEVNGQKKIVYLKLQVPGIASHAWLVDGMEVIENGYELSIVDSNYLTEIRVQYHFGDVTISHDFGNTMPYIRRRGDYSVMLTELLRFCRPAVAMKRWKKSLNRHLEEATSQSQRDLISWSLSQADQGHFTPLFREETLQKNDLTPMGWHQLMKK